LVLAATKSPGTKVFVKYLGGNRLLHVNVNGVKVAELGSGETTVADARIGANVIKLQKFGYLAPNEGASKSFSMEINQQRFFVYGTEIFHHPNPKIILYRPIVVELRQTEFFGQRASIVIKKFAPR
jgi:hypothetical protein